MTVVQIDKKDDYDSFKVTKEKYHKSDLFEKVSHIGPKSTHGFFLYFKSSKLGRPHSNYLFYDSKPLKKIEVYFSKFKSEQFLAVIIYLQSIAKYFTYSYLKGFNRPGSLDGPVLSVNKLLDILINENYKTNGTIIYRLDSKDTNGYKNVTVQKAANDPFDGILKYTHEPQNGITMKSNILSYDDLIKTDLEEAIQNREYNCVNVYYHIKGVTEESDACLIELKGRDGTNVYLKKNADEGPDWVEEKCDPDSGVNCSQSILLDLDYERKKSIKIYIDKKEKYTSKLINNSSIIDNQTSFEQIISVYQDDCKIRPNYTCFYHDISNLTQHSEFNSIIGLRLYIGGNTNGRDTEITLSNEQGTKNKYLFYDKLKIKLFVYFYKHNSKIDTIPLLFRYNDKWYAPNSKVDYLQKWNEISNLEDSSGDTALCSSKCEEIKSQLNTTNDMLNEIDISNKQTYGILDNPPLTYNSFDTKRVEVTKENQANKYWKTTHKTVNKARVPLIKYKGNSLSTIKSSTDQSQVTVYYQSDDSNLENPLLIGLGNQNSDPTDFYERIGRDNELDWKKITEGSNDLNNPERLGEKLNNISYDFNKSIPIKINKQSEYSVSLIENRQNMSSKSLQQQSENINVSIHSSHISNYECYKHDMSSVIGTKEKEIGGLRFYIDGHEIKTHRQSNSTTSKLHYKKGKYNVYVFFYKEDKVPLLFNYHDKWYYPNATNDYFNKWIEASGISGIIDYENIKKRLHQVNKSLNEIDISKTTGEYGIPRNEERQTTTLKTKRVTVQRENCLNKYGKIIHSTVNQYEIGHIKYNGVRLKIENDSDDKNYNQLSTYYLTTDSNYKVPLLILLETKEIANEKVWYKRTNVDLTEWELVHDLQLVADENIKNELINIQKVLYTSIKLCIEKKDQYEVWVNTNASSERQSYSVEIEKYGTCGGFKVDNYRCCEHKLDKFYKNFKMNQNSQIQSSTIESKQFYFELCISISESEISIFNSTSNEIEEPFYYTYKEGVYNYNLFVYFYESNGDEDTVPLLFEYENKFYAPITKSDYFLRWKEVARSTDRDIRDKVKQKLDEVNKMLNEIGLLHVSDYGLSISSKDSTFNTKRISVVPSEFKPNLIKVTHSTLNGYNIGDIKYNGYTFEDYSHRVEEKINELVVFIMNDNQVNSKPQLVLVNNKYGSNSDTYGYYDLTKVPDFNEYKFTKINEPLSLDYELIQKNGSFDGIDEDLKQIFQRMLKHPVLQTGGHKQPNVNGNGQSSSPSPGSTEPSSSVDVNLSVSQSDQTQHSVLSITLSGESVHKTPVSTPSPKRDSDTQVPTATSKSTGISQPPPSDLESHQVGLKPSEKGESSPPTVDSSAKGDRGSTGGTQPNEDNSNTSTDIIKILKENLPAVSGGAAGSVVLTGVSGYGIYRGCIKVK